MLMMSPFLSTRPDGRGLPKISAGSSIGVEPMMRKSMSPPPSMMAAPAAALSSYSFTPGFAHLVAHGGVAALVLLLGELLPHAVPIIGRVAHVGEWERLVELVADRL